MHLQKTLFFLAAIHAAGATMADTASVIAWEPQLIEMALPLGAERVAAEFHFTNKSNQPLSIKQISINCGCTAATHTREAVASGASGFVRMEFNAGQRRGIQRNAAIIHFEPDTIPPQRIEFVVTIPDVITARPQLLRWPAGGLDAPRHLVIVLNPAVGARLTKIEFAQEHFELILEHGPAHLAEGAEWSSIRLVEAADANASLRMEIRPRLANPPSESNYTVVLHAITDQGTHHNLRLFLRLQ